MTHPPTGGGGSDGGGSDGGSTGPGRVLPRFRDLFRVVGAVAVAIAESLSGRTA